MGFLCFIFLKVPADTKSRGQFFHKIFPNLRLRAVLFTSKINQKYNIPNQKCPPEVVPGQRGQMDRTSLTVNAWQRTTKRACDKRSK